MPLNAARLRGGGFLLRFFFFFRGDSCNAASFIPGVPDGAARLKTRSAGWNRAGLELNTLDG